jgi:hypothetical protein
VEDEMNAIVLTEKEKAGFQKAFDYCKNWSAEHQAEVGLAEMVAGAGMIYWGLHSGHIHYGTHVLVDKLAGIGGAAAAGAGAFAGPVMAATILKSVFIGGVAGVAGVTLAPAIPLIALAGGGALIFGAFGYSLTDIVARSFAPSFADYAVDASITSVGIALLIDGARRIVKDKRVLAMASKFKAGVLELVSGSTETIIKTWDELRSELNMYPQAGIFAGTVTVAGTLIGSSLAASSVTVLGSHGLGAAALSLGLISAPIWPVFAGGAVGLALAYPAWKVVKYVYDRNTKQDIPESRLSLPGPTE